MVPLRSHGIVWRGSTRAALEGVRILHRHHAGRGAGTALRGKTFSAGSAAARAAAGSQYARSAGRRIAIGGLARAPDPPAGSAEAYDIRSPHRLSGKVAGLFRR